MTKIKNIVFDMGGVLIDLDWNACVSAFTDNGFPQAKDILSPYLPSGIFMQLEMGKIPTCEFYQHIKDNADSPITDEQIDYSLNKFLVGLPIYKLEMLRKLKETYNVYMLSNTSSIILNYVDAHMFTQEGFTREAYFDRRYVSFEMQLLKPDSSIYESMLADSGMIPSETLFLDDSPANIATAQKLGIQTYHVSPMEDYRNYLFSL